MSKYFLFLLSVSSTLNLFATNNEELLRFNNITDNKDRRLKLSKLLENQKSVNERILENQKKIFEGKNTQKNNLIKKLWTNDISNAISNILIKKNDFDLENLKRISIQSDLATKMSMISVEKNMDKIENSIIENGLNEENIVKVIFKEFIELIPKDVIDASLLDEKLSKFVDEQFVLFIEKVNIRLQKYDIQIYHEGSLRKFIEKWETVINDTEISSMHTSNYLENTNLEEIQNPILENEISPDLMEISNIEDESLEEEFLDNEKIVERAFVFDDTENINNNFVLSSYVPLQLTNNVVANKVVKNAENKVQNLSDNNIDVGNTVFVNSIETDFSRGRFKIDREIQYTSFNNLNLEVHDVQHDDIKIPSNYDLGTSYENTKRLFPSFRDGSNVVQIKKLIEIDKEAKSHIEMLNELNEDELNSENSEYKKITNKKNKKSDINNISESESLTESTEYPNNDSNISNDEMLNNEISENETTQVAYKFDGNKNSFSTFEINNDNEDYIKQTNCNVTENKNYFLPINTNSSLNFYLKSSNYKFNANNDYSIKANIDVQKINLLKAKTVFEEDLSQVDPLSIF